MNRYYGRGEGNNAKGKLHVLFSRCGVLLIAKWRHMVMDWDLLVDGFWGGLFQARDDE